MRIVDVAEITKPIASPIRNAYIDFSKMTASLVAVVTDVVRDGRRVVGYGFNSNGRYGQGGLIRDSSCMRTWGTHFMARLCKRCGLSASEQATRRDNEGRQVSSTRWFHPKLLGTVVSRTTLRLTVRARMGQTVDDLERAVPAIRDAAGAHSARSVVIAPGTLRIELVMREQLSTVGNAAPPTAVATTRVTLGRSENGLAWTLPLSGRHTLTVGCSGAGKGSVFWGIAGGLGPAVARRRGLSGGNRPEIWHRGGGRLQPYSRRSPPPKPTQWKP